MQFPKHAGTAGHHNPLQPARSLFSYDPKNFRDQDPCSVLQHLVKMVDGMCQDKHKEILNANQPNRGYQSTAAPSNPTPALSSTDMLDRTAFLLAPQQWAVLTAEDRLLLLNSLSVVAELCEPRLSPNSKVKFVDIETFLELLVRVSEARKLLCVQVGQMKQNKTFHSAVRASTHTVADKLTSLDSLGITLPLTSMIQVCTTLTRFVRQAGEDMSTRQLGKMKSLLDICQTQYAGIVESLDPRQEHAVSLQSQREIFALLGLPSNTHLHPGFVQLLLLPGNQTSARGLAKDMSTQGGHSSHQEPMAGASLESLARREESPLNLVIDFLLTLLSASEAVAPLGPLPTHHLQELVTALLVAKRYGSRTFETASKELLTLLIKKVDILLGHDERDGQDAPASLSDEEMEELVKTIKTLFGLLDGHNNTNPHDSSSSPGALAISRLECLWALKRGDLQKVLLYKQSLSGANTSTSDFSFDLLLDLVRYCNHCQPSIELFVLLRKINSSAAKQWLQTNGVLESVKKVLCPKRTSISKDRDATSLVCFTLLCQSALPHSLNNFFEALSETFLQLSQVEHPVQDSRAEFGQSQMINEGTNPARGWLMDKANQLATYLDWHTAEDLVTSLQVRVAALRSCYLGFYFFKNIGRFDQAQHYATRLFRLGDGVQSLWKIARTNAELFLDIVEVITAETPTSDLNPEHISQTGSIIQLLSEPSQDDTEDVSMYKALLRTKIYLTAQDLNRPPQEQAISDFSQVLKVIPLETVYTVLRRNLKEPVVYYPFFFSLISHYLDHCSNTQVLGDPMSRPPTALTPSGLFSLLMSVMEEQIERMSAKEYSYSKVRGYMPPLLKKALALFESSPECRELGSRASVHLYNMYLEDQDPEVLELAYVYGLRQNNPFADVVAVYAIERVRSGKGFKKEEALGMQEWLETVKLRAKAPEGIKPEQNAHQMDEEDFEYELEALIQGESTNWKGPSKVDSCPKPTILSKEVVSALELSLKHAIDPQSAVSLISTLMLDTDPRVKSVVLFTASKLSRSAYSTALRGYLSYLTTQSSESKESLLEIYMTLLKTTDSTKELKTYFRLLEDLVRSSSSREKPFPLHGLANLTAEMVLLQADFPSLSAELRQLSQTIKTAFDQWENEELRETSSSWVGHDRALHVGTTALLRLRSALDTLTQ